MKQVKNCPSCRQQIHYRCLSTQLTGYYNSYFPHKRTCDYCADRRTVANRKRKQLESLAFHEAGTRAEKSHCALGEKPWSEWQQSDARLQQETGFDKDCIDFLFTLCKDALSEFHGRKKIRHAPNHESSRAFLSRHNLLLLALTALWKNRTDRALSSPFCQRNSFMGLLRCSRFRLRHTCWKLADTLIHSVSSTIS